MKNLIASIKQWWVNECEARKVKNAAKRAAQMERHSCTVINCMEFDGKLYVCHNGTPIIRVDRLNTEVTKAVAEARKDYIAWSAKFDN